MAISAFPVLSSFKSLLGICLAGSLLLIACAPAENKTDGKAESGTAQTESVPVQKSDRKTAAPKVDEALMAELKTIASLCEVNVSGNTVTGCKADEKQKLVSRFERKEADPVAALDTLAVALGDTDEKLAVVASSVLYSAFQNFGKLQKGAVSPDVAYHLIEAVGKAPQYRAAQSVHAAVHAAMLAGENAALYQMLDSHAYPPLPSLGYPDLMRYGRLDALPQIQKIAQSPDEKLAVAALSAPVNMYEASAEEKKAICPWAQGYLGDKRAAVYQSAGRVMLWCGGPSIDALQDEGDKRLAAHQFGQDDYLLYRDVCFTPVKGLIPEAGQDKQCQRNQVFLEKAVNDDKLDSTSRGLALFAIYYQRRNAESMQIMKKYKNHADPKIKQYANQAIASLVGSYKIPE